MNFEKIKNVIVETVNIDEASVHPESELENDLGLDSLDAVELAIALEEKFGVSIDDEVLSSFKTVQDITKFIDSTL